MSLRVIRLPLFLALALVGWACNCGGGGPGGPSVPAPTPHITLHGWYITQAIQKLDRSVPLVAGREGVLRVFLTANSPNQAAPAVRVTLTGGAHAPWQRTIAAPGATVPTECHEDQMNSSRNLPIPGDVLAPNAHIQLEVDPGGGAAGIAPAARNVQSALTVHRVPIIRITLVPVLQSGLTGEVESGGRTRNAWVARFRAMYPVSRIDLRVDPNPLRTTANLNHHANADHDWVQLLGELKALRLSRGEAGRYYYGVVKRSSGQGTVGDTPVAGQEAAGWDDLAGYQDTFAHEMGHALGRNHAPCGVAVYGHDTGWPADAAHAGAALGAVGLDVATLTVKPSPQFKDIMGYCPPYWVSDTTYTGIMRWQETAGVSLDYED